MLSSSLKINIETWLFIFIALTLPFYQQATIIAIIALVLIWILQKKYLLVPSVLKNNPLLILWISYFFLHLTGLLWSTNLQYGWLDIQTKLSFLLFPVVLGTTVVSPSVFRKIKSAFIAGNIIACICCIISSTIQYLQTADQSVFFYTSLSSFLHVTYFTVYLNLALLLFLNELIGQWKNMNVIQKTIEIIAMLLITVMIILLSARTAIAASFLTVLFYSITQVIRYKKGVILLVVAFTVVSLINLTAVKICNRYTQVEDEIKSHSPSDPISATTIPKTYNSTQARIEFWKNAIVVIKQNLLLGVGTGDIKEELVDQYKKNDFQYGVENKFSPHNQYLHTGVILGVTGIILLLLCLLLPLRLAIKQRNWLYVCFLTIILLNAITESILERQNGIIFYAFFNVLFYMQMVSVKNNELA